MHKEILKAIEEDNRGRGRGRERERERERERRAHLFLPGVLEPAMLLLLAAQRSYELRTIRVLRICPRHSVLLLLLLQAPVSASASVFFRACSSERRNQDSSRDKHIPETAAWDKRRLHTCGSASADF